MCVCVCAGAAVDEDGDRVVSKVKKERASERERGDRRRDIVLGDRASSSAMPPSLTREYLTPERDLLLNNVFISNSESQPL